MITRTKCPAYNETWMLFGKVNGSLDRRVRNAILTQGKNVHEWPAINRPRSRRRVSTWFFEFVAVKLSGRQVHRMLGVISLDLR